MQYIISQLPENIIQNYHDCIYPLVLSNINKLNKQLSHENTALQAQMFH